MKKLKKRWLHKVIGGVLLVTFSICLYLDAAKVEIQDQENYRMIYLYLISSTILLIGLYLLNDGLKYKNSKRKKKGKKIK